MKAAWLKEPPPLEYIVHSKESGRDYIPIGFTEIMLDELCEDDEPWSTENFFSEIVRCGDKYVANSSVDLIVNYDGKRRVVTGAKSFIVSSYSENKDYCGASLSHCINSAAQKLGNRFGRSLNGRTDAEHLANQSIPETPEDSIDKRPKIDAITLRKYENALRSKNEKIINEIESRFNLNTPEALLIVNSIK